MREWFQRFLTLQVIVVSFVTLLLVASSATIIAYNHKSHEEATLDLFHQLSDQVSEKVIHRTSTYLRPAQVATGLVADQVQYHPELLEQDSEALMQFMASILREFPQLASTYIGVDDGTFFQLRREIVDETDPPSEIYIRRRIDRFPVYPDALVEFQVGDLALSSLGDAYAVTPTYQSLEDEAAIEAVVAERDRMEMVTMIGGQVVGIRSVSDNPDTSEVERSGVEVLWPQNGYRVGFTTLSDEPLALNQWMERTRAPIEEIIEMIEGADEVNIVENRTEVGPIDGLTISENVQTVDYDPRTRTWYQTAEREERFAWSDVYIFALKQIPGLSAARPIYGPEGEMLGVASSDITLEQISEFLRTQTLGAGSRVMIVDGEGQIIAYPDPEVYNQEGSELDLPHMATLNSTTMHAWTALRETGPGQTRLEVDGEAVLGSFVTFPDNFGTDWTLVILVPEEALLGRANEIQENSLVIGLLIVGVSMLVVSIFARRISGPINRLSEQVDSVRNFHLDNDFSTRSGIWEVKNMAQALHSMQAGLQSFSRYVPSNLVRQLVDSGEVARLGGERKQLAILFSDVANFTTLAEEMEAEFLMQHLSAYLEMVSKILTEEHATIDKYIGDAVMAFWGAPNEDARPTERACMAALRCHLAVTKMNTEWRKQEKPILPTRFGVHVGTTVVGNIGSSDRMNYTVIGDSVNVAARLEAANKFYGTWILVSEAVIDEVGHLFVHRPVDIVAVKGKAIGIGIHELVATKTGPLAATSEEQRLCEEFTRIFAIYLDRRWDEALLDLENLSRQWPEDRVIDQLIERCRAFRENPPPDDWTGVKILDQK